MKQAEIVLVTGATGFVGAYLIRHLLQNGYQVRGLKRTGSNLDLLGPIAQQVSWVEADVCDVVALEAAMDGVQVVCHGAALVSFHPKDYEAMRQINVDGTANVVNLCLAKNIRKLIHISSIAALGRTPTRLELDERAEWVDSKDNTVYAQTKHLAELEVWRGVAEGLNAIIICPSVVVGVQRWQDGTAAFFEKIEKGLKLYPTGKSGFVDVRDVAIFITRMIRSDLSGTRFILNAENLSHQAFFALIARSLGVPPPRIPVGPFLAALAWRVEWLKEKLLGSKPLVTRESARASVTQYYYRNEKSLSVPGFEYRSIKQTVDEIAAAYKKRNEAGGNIQLLDF